MNRSGVEFSVFTKPWKMALPELGSYVKGLGFDAIELPVRPGYPVEPDTCVVRLAAAVKALSEEGIRIASIAGPTDAATIAACGEAGIEVIRICPRLNEGEEYMAYEDRVRREFDGLVPHLAEAGVKLGIQNHCGRWVCNGMGLHHLIESYDPQHVSAVLDFAHCALAGEQPEMALDMVWPHLCMVNLKNAFWRRATGPEAEVAEWKTYWTSGRQGLASWPKAIHELRTRNYEGVVCLTAEYSDHANVDRLIKADIAFARQLFGNE